MAAFETMDYEEKVQFLEENCTKYSSGIIYICKGCEKIFVPHEEEGKCLPCISCEGTFCPSCALTKFRPTFTDSCAACEEGELFPVENTQEERELLEEILAGMPR